MIFENTSITGIENAIKGMRLPMCRNLQEVEKKSDTRFNKIGEKDMDLAIRLVKYGEPHCKFLRMIHAQVCITAPLYWWKEIDQYKIGTTTNSTSTMHKLASTPITRDCFEMDDFKNLEGNFLVQDNGSDDTDGVWYELIENLEWLRWKYNETKDKRYWKELIRLLPESWLQTRMIDFNYSTIRNIYSQRKNHKLEEWHAFCDWVETLPYFNEFLK